MKKENPRYTRYALCREMLETPGVMRSFIPEAASKLTNLVDPAAPLMLTGEGSSRIFPAKRVRIEALRKSDTLIPFTEGATQAGEYHLSDWNVLGASNSGRTRELIRLYRDLKAAGHSRLGGVTAFDGSVLSEAAAETLVLGCGTEDAVAATKSVVEQAMVWQAVLGSLAGRTFPDTGDGASLVEQALTTEVPPAFAEDMAGARTIFFAGRNDGVAEELTLKTNEIVRKPSDFLEGTYAAHGIEEIMSADDVVVLVNPFPDEEAKLADCIGKGVGATILAIADRDTMFPTLRVPARGDWAEYVLLAGGWNLLVEAGLAAGIDLDKPERARKVGNEVD